jgi:hypothetical protein
MRRFAAHLRPMLDMAPPRLGTGAWADTSGLLRLAWQVRSLGRTDMRELLRIIGMNVYDLAEEHFDSRQLQAAVAFDAVLGTNFGPRAPGTVLTLLYRLAAENGNGATATAQPRGGMGAVSDALAAAARAAGAEIRTGVRVKHVLVRGDRAAGVVLADGTTIESASVISNADPRTTFLHLLGPQHLDTGFVRPAAVPRPGRGFVTWPPDHCADARLYRERIQREQIRCVFRSARHGNRAADGQRPWPCPVRPARAVGHCAIRSLYAHRRLGQRAAKIPRPHHRCVGILRARATQ